MSGLIPITVSTPPGEEAHIRAEDDASIYQSLFGGDGVSTVGQACKATVLSNNKVRIADGIICVGGHFARIPYGDYIDCEIDSGQSSKNRNDIIVARLETTGTGGIDTYTCEVKKGTAGSTATDPEIVQEDLYKAGKVRELPLYRVKIEGLSITAVEQLFTLRKTNEELEKELESLNSKIAGMDWSERETIGQSIGLTVMLRRNAYMYQVEVGGIINGSSIPVGGRKLCDLPEGLKPPSSTHRYMTVDSRLSIQINSGGIYLHATTNISSTSSGINVAFIEPLI